MRCVWVVVVLAGCGRLGFDAVPSLDGRSEDASADGDGACVLGTWGAPVPVAELDTASEEVDPSVMPDQLRIYFSSNRVGTMARGIWSAKRASTALPWGTAELAVTLDSTFDESAPAVSASNLEILYTSTAAGPTTIFVSTRGDVAQPFPFGTQLMINGDTVTPRYTPAFSADGLTLYYARDLELAVATRAVPSGAFTFVRELDEINDPSTDSSPTISADGLELYFQSYRLGSAAIFRATRAAATDPFGAPLEQLSLVPAGATETGAPELSSDGRTIYFYAEVGGQDDLYVATRDCL